MTTKGIRGAITVENNTKEAIKEATLELLQEIVQQNNIDKNMISHAIFTLTPDLNADFPAKYARIDFGWDNVAMMCYNELNVPDSLKMCLRILVVLNTTPVFTPKFVYLKGAKTLRG